MSNSKMYLRLGGLVLAGAAAVSGTVLAQNHVWIRSNIPPLRVGECGPFSAGECRIVITPTVGAEGVGSEPCHVKATDVNPGVLLASIPLFENARRIRWVIDGAQSDQFRFARKNETNPGIKIVGPAPGDFGDAEEEEDSDEREKRVRSVKIDMREQGRLKAFHYNIQLIYRSGGVWVPCKPLDPLIVNRG